MAQDTITVRSLTARATTGSGAEQTLQMSLNGAAAADTVAIPAGSSVWIKNLTLGSAVPATFRLQWAADGSTFTDIGLFNTSTLITTASYTPLVGWVLDGSSTAVFRLRVTTPSGAALVHADVRTYTETTPS